ncbi:hypothetical protein [Desulfobacterium sp. N47]|uniref:Uncharacterized protein n=1 Tax=uncultured Desulfobacterium sp. TaxID=201089 RepID=E1YH42_9BACT|nr:hypothetical protein N47_F15810 [uncultured Desulfobacterium sp.]
MTTSLKSKTIEQLMAEADELVKKINAEHINDLKEEHRIQFEKHAQKLQELKAKVHAGNKETTESHSSAEGIHEAILDIIKAMHNLTTHKS